MKDAISKLPFPFLGANVYDTTWDERVFDAYKIFEKGGRQDRRHRTSVPLLSDRQSALADARLVVRHPRGGRGGQCREGEGRGCRRVVLLSHNGFDVDRKLAGRVEGIDVILTGHTHDALPEPVIVGKTVLVATGSHGKFLSRIDLDVGKGALKGFRHRLIPIFSDVITPDAEMAKKIDGLRAPYEDHLGRSLRRPRRFSTAAETSTARSTISSAGRCLRSAMRKSPFRRVSAGAPRCFRGRRSRQRTSTIPAP